MFNYRGYPWHCQGVKTWHFWRQN